MWRGQGCGVIEDDDLDRSGGGGGGELSNVEESNITLKPL